MSAPQGCELCGDWPVVLLPRCHPTAPLRAEMISEYELVLRCYLPTCGREVVRFEVAPAKEPGP